MKMCAYRFSRESESSIFSANPPPPALEIPIAPIQIPPLIIFRHTWLFTLFVPHPTAHVFHPPHGAEEVPAGEVGEIVLGPTAFD